MNKGDFVKLFGQVRTYVDDKGKEHKNVRILSFKLLKSREQEKGQAKEKKSILGQITGYQEQNRTSIKNNGVHDKGLER